MKSKFLFPSLLSVILLALLLVTVKECNSLKQDLNNSQRYSRQVLDSFYVYKTEMGKLQARQEQRIISSQDQMEALSKKIEGIEKVTSQVTVRTETLIRDTFYVNNSGQIKDSCLPLPSKFSRKSKYYQISGLINESGSLTIDSLSFYSSLSLTIGEEEKKWYQFFKPTNKVVSFQDENPYTRVKSMDNLILEDKVFPLSLGLQLGVGTNPSFQFSPFIGVGLNYSLIQF